MILQNNNSFIRLVNILDELREKCPWDKKQTIHTLRQLTIEELYELIDAIDNENWDEIKEEIGDLLLHILFYAKIASEKNKFSIDEMINTICEKLINRHPHIYGNIKVQDDEDVKRNWEKIKLAEGKKSVLSGVPVSLPSIVKATRLQEKAKQVGFEWNKTEDVWKKVIEELDELQTAVKYENKNNIEEEFGDVIFTLINYARFLNIDADAALEKTNKKFKERFMLMEKLAIAQNNSIQNMKLDEMNELWNESKIKLK